MDKETKKKEKLKNILNNETNDIFLKELNNKYIKKTFIIALLHDNSRPIANILVPLTTLVRLILFC